MTAQVLVDRGIAMELAGNAAGALESYAQAIAADPGFALAHMNLGIALYNEDRFGEAIDAHRRAIALDSDSAPAHFNLALALLQTDEADIAETEFREALRLRAEFPEAWVGLAEALESREQYEEALAALDRATSQRDQYPGAQFNSALLLLKLGKHDAAQARLNEIDLDSLLPVAERHGELEYIARQMILMWPDHVPAWRVLGTLLALQKRFEEAVPALQESLARGPSEPQVLNNLGVALQALGRLSEAEEACRSATRMVPDYIESHNNLGKILLADGRPGEAEACFGRALELDSECVDALISLADALRLLGRPEAAEQCYRRALQLQPDSPATLNGLGIVLQNQGRLSEAEADYRRALELNPGFHLAHGNLGNCLQAQRRLSEAEASYTKALALDPGSATLFSNLGSALRELGRLAEAEASFRQALALDPASREAHSNLLFSLNYADRSSRAEVFGEHRDWARRHETPLVASRLPHANTRNPARKLRIGYVSPDFRRHSVAYFIEPLLARHDRSRFDIFCYSNVITPDGVTRHLLGQADFARNIVPLSDAETAELVRTDGIDILVDLAGHSANGRLGLFALKPAPVQVSYLGYPNTTGIDAIDWRLTDVYADPPGNGDGFHSERLARLPNTFLCFRPPTGAPEIGPAPHLTTGFITFGSFNALPKITREVISAWAQILNQVAGSRLQLKAMGLDDTPARHRTIDEFARHGIAADRLTVLPMDHDFGIHLARYREIDIALDSFPYNGTTTTLEALWMGVPVVGLIGDRHSARVGTSILSNLGLESLLAANTQQYVTVAANLALASARLAALRTSMRGRVSDSPLRDEAKFAADLENAYREMWRDWCST